MLLSAHQDSAQKCHLKLSEAAWIPEESRDSSVGIALGYGLDDWGSRVWFRGGGAGDFSLQYRVQSGSGAHPTSYPMGTRGSFPGGKSGWGVKLTTQLLLVLRSKMRGAILPLPQYVFMAWCLVKHRDNFTFIITSYLRISE
jgi:hypothetical protein